jgi:hypothetical protein
MCFTKNNLSGVDKLTIREILDYLETTEGKIWDETINCSGKYSVPEISRLFNSEYHYNYPYSELIKTVRGINVYCRYGSNEGIYLFVDIVRNQLIGTGTSAQFKVESLFVGKTLDHNKLLECYESAGRIAKYLMGYW